ncbi:FAD-dependent oxidoreductase [Candidatus Uhrbacteria bacterium]|nr:FAD-dependent oxidoreductase [Candidatus Uhrbacteria bacterium]
MVFQPPQKRNFRVVSNKQIAAGQFELSFSPIDDKPMFNFIPGQWVMIELPDPHGGKIWKSAYSISNAPHTAKEQFEIAIKIDGDFTKRLERLVVGDVITAQGPYGVFTLKPGTSPLVIFAGGVGYTPFRSMIQSIIASNDPREIKFFYSNRTQVEIAYEHEFRELSKKQLRFKPIFILTQETRSDRNFEYRRLDREMLLKYVPDLQIAEFLMCGSRSFMESVRTILEQEGVDVKTRLRKELFD